MEKTRRRNPSPFKLIGDDPASPDGRYKEYDWPQVPVGYYVGATLFSFFSAGICFYWAAFPLVNTVYTHGYTAINQFNSSRYQWDWWFVWLLSFNVALPLMFQHAITNNGTGVWGKIHKLLCGLVIWINIVSLGALTVQWIFFCNNSASGLYSACNDYRWCGRYFGGTGGICPNGVMFPGDFNVEYSDLSRNTEMLTHWIYCFVFTVHAWIHISVNADYIGYGILK